MAPSLILRLRTLSAIRFMALILVIKLVFALIASKLIFLLFNRDVSAGILEEQPFLFRFYMLVLVAPLLETLFILYYPFLYLGKYLKPNQLIILTALAFGAIHSYNLYYMIVSVISGFIYSYAYYQKLHTGYAFFIIAAIHALYNLIVLLMNYI